MDNSAFISHHSLFNKRSSLQHFRLNPIRKLMPAIEIQIFRFQGSTADIAVGVAIGFRTGGLKDVYLQNNAGPLRYRVFGETLS
jgi:hypothetical protein